MRTKFLVICTSVMLLLSMLFLVLPGTVQAEERILFFISGVQFDKDGTISVTELIKVNVEHKDIKHGIYRTYPSSRVLGTTLKNYGFNIQSIKLDGEPVKYSVNYGALNVGVAIGDPKQKVSVGQHEYEIKYKTRNHVLFGNDRDEIYFNVTGNDWKLPIERASFVLIIPGGEDNILEATAFTGAYGERGTDFVQHKKNVLRTTRRLEPGEGFTVAAAWKKGLVAPSEQSHFDWIGANRELAYGLIFVFILLYYFLQKWWLMRQPDQTVIPLFSPPFGMSPGYMAALKAKGYPGRVLHADIVWAAVNGFLHMDLQDKKNIVLHRRNPSKKISTWINNQCEHLVYWLCDSEGMCVLRTARGKKQAGEAFEFLVQEYHERLEFAWEDSILTKTFGWIFVGAFMIYVTLCSAHPGLADGTLTAMEFLGFAGMCLVFICIGYYATRKALDEREGMARIFTVATALTVFTGGGLVGLWFVALGDYVYLGLSSGVFLLTFWLMKRLPGGKYTYTGLTEYAKVQGLEMYIRTAEKHRLEKINAPDDTIEKYEELLPYAIALNCADAWQKRFDKLLHDLDYEPEWVGIVGGEREERYSYDTVVRRVTVSASMSVAIAASVAVSNISSITSPPDYSSSGSGFSGSGSSGGSSGGGSGGGGGGGW